MSDDLTKWRKAYTEALKHTLSGDLSELMDVIRETGYGDPEKVLKMGLIRAIDNLAEAIRKS